MLALLAVFSLAAHPKLTWQKCTKGGCTTQNGFIVGDTTAGDIDYETQQGVTVSGDTVKQRLVTNYNGKKIVGSRLYLLASDEQNYELFNFVNKEIAYDIDISQIPCGVNAAFYTVEMPKNGGTTGAAAGGGYCDGNYVDGEGCFEMDIQEANNKAMVYTMHTCQNTGVQASNGQCDGNGCGINTYRDNDKQFWGTTVNTAQKMTVVTQFLGSGTAVTQIKRLYVQNGKVIQSPGSITDSGCGNSGWHTLAHLGESFTKGHVLVFSLWDSNGMSWLDSGNNGPCGSYDINTIESQSPGLTVTWSNIKFGDIDSTY
uniref:cellulase n=1 Tax=uncultured symbiotic protist of Cryptocercus punctulatus TaxID=403662 RepID=A4UX52_9EUKA|nr:putative glycosyl hydrolase family7 [uncultured symbiotic protist of Cryptocercus punctulatus]